MKQIGLNDRGVSKNSTTQGCDRTRVDVYYEQATAREITLRHVCDVFYIQEGGNGWVDVPTDERVTHFGSSRQ